MIDTLFTNGVIHTMDPKHPRGSALAVSGGRIVAVGGEELQALAGPDTHRVDLGGRCVLPGMTDSHIHFKTYALSLQKVDLSGARSLQEMLEMVAKRAADTLPGEWIRGFRWDQEVWPDRRFPSAADLDAVTPQNPVALSAKSGHALVTNSLGLQRAGINADTPDPPGAQIVRDDNGLPTGLMLEDNAMKLVTNAAPSADAEKVAAALPDAFRHAWQVGLTGIHDMDNLVSFEAHQRLRARGALGLRVVSYLPIEALDPALELRLRAGMGDDRLRVGGIKIFADGALGPHTATMLEPYADDPGNLGILTMEPEEMEDVVRRAAGGGLPLAIHAIGDAANRMVLNVLEAAGASNGEGKRLTMALPHRIEHVQLLHPDDVGRLAALGIVAAMQPIHATEDAPMADRYWGERCATAYAWRSLLEAGTLLAFGSDCPVETMNPFAGIHAAVTRKRSDGYGGSDGWYPEQRLTVEEAVQAYTCGPARAAGLEERLGSLSPGKWADLMVIDRDIFAGDPDSILQTQVDGTMIEGEWVLGLDT